MKTRKTKQDVIDVKEGNEKIFPIGHSPNISMTQLPIFHQNPSQKGSYYVDIPEVSNAEGTMIDLIN